MLIKAGQAGKIRRRLATVDLADHLAEARSVVEEARREAARITQQAKRRAAEALEEASRAGHETGYKTGLVEGREAGRAQAHRESIERFNEQHAAIVADMKRAIAEIDGMKADLRIAAEHDLIDFAVKVASKLTFEIGSLRREAAVENLRRAIDLVGENTGLTIRVHPDDVESMRTFADSVLRQVDESTAISLVEDKAIAPGGCIIEGGRTKVDATLKTQVSEMIAVLLGEEADDA